MKIKKTLNNNVAIQLDGDNDHVITPSGIKLYIDNTYEPEKHVVVTGKVVSVPEKLKFHIKKPNLLPWETEMELKIGDRVVVYYLAVVNAMKRETKKIFYEDGKQILITSYKNVFCITREDKVIPINGYCLIKPEEDMMYTQMEKRAGKVGLVISKLDSKNINRVVFGKVKFTGKPNKKYIDDVYSDDKVDIREDDTVIMRKVTDIPIEYDLHQTLKEEYFRVQRKDVFAILK